MSNDNSVIKIDLSDKGLPSFETPHGTFAFVEAICDPTGSLAVIHYALNGVRQENGVALDLDKQTFIDDFGDTDPNKELKKCAKDVATVVYFEQAILTNTDKIISVRGKIDPIIVNPNKKYTY
jgi:hypothetical protein